MAFEVDDSCFLLVLPPCFTHRKGANSSIPDDESESPSLSTESLHVHAPIPIILSPLQQPLVRCCIPFHLAWYSTGSTLRRVRSSIPFPTPTNTATKQKGNVLEFLRNGIPPKHRSRIHES